MQVFGDDDSIPDFSVLYGGAGQSLHACSQDDDNWPDAAWNIDFESMFQCTSPESSAGTDSQIRLPPSLPELPVCSRDLSPAGLLYTRSFKDSPQLNFPPQPLKRMRGKTSPDIGVGIALLQANSRTLIGSAGVAWQDRRLAVSMYQRAYAAASGRSIRNTLKESKILWDASDEAAKGNWNFWRSVHAKLYSYDISKHCAVRIPLPNGDILAPDACHSVHMDPVLCDAFGILLTYHTSLGLYSPAVLQFVAEGYTGHALVAKLKTLPTYEAEFDAFWTRVQDIGISLGFSARAASMEMCFSSVPKGRVHLHAFLGHAISWQGWQRDAAKVQIRLSHLLWQGLRPNMQAMRPWGRSRNLSLLAANGLYYVLGDKKGSMYSAGTCRPFEDRMFQCCPPSSMTYPIHVR